MRRSRSLSSRSRRSSPTWDARSAASLTSGSFSLKGSLRHGVKPGGPQTTFQGGFKLDDLRLVETGVKDTLAGWKSLQTDQLTLELEPNRLEIGDLKIVRPVGRFIIEKDHSINMVKVVKTDQAAKKPRTGETRAPRPTRSPTGSAASS